MDKRRMAAMSVNMTWCLVDMLEGQMMDMEEQINAIGMSLYNEQKMYFQRAIKALRSLRGYLKVTSEETQMGFGEDSDMYLQFLWALVDRSGGDDLKALRFYDYVKSFPSLEGIDLEKMERNAFGHVRNYKSKKQ